MEIAELLAYGIFISYFLLIAIFFVLTLISVFHNVKIGDGFTGRPFLFSRTAVGALLCTWYFMFKFMGWSWTKYSISHHQPTIGLWLRNTALFEQAWSIVSTGPVSWWWSSWICTWTVLFTAILWRENARRNIKYPWAYLILGMLVAISVSTSLFITAIFLHPVTQTTPRAAPRVYIPLGLALYTIYLTPSLVGTDDFLKNLLRMHALLILPVALPSPPTLPLTITGIHTTPPPVSMDSLFSIPWRIVTPALTLTVAAIHGINTSEMLNVIPASNAISRLWTHIFHHPAQASISLDVVWVWLSVGLWFLVSGGTATIVIKVLTAGSIAAVVIARKTGVNWGLILSVVPIAALLAVGLIAMQLQRIRGNNAEKRRAVLEGLGIEENAMIPGTKDSAPSISGSKVVVGFWHPYCNAGGGGERVLWSAIKHLQKTQPDVVSLVYTGDYPTASKAEILGKVEDRFSIDIDSTSIQFIPLHSRHLISDNHWKSFTLLGQSFGSVILAWQGLTGRDGVWGDIFIDTMGYAFTLPFVRFVTGGEVTVGSYIHYPTVSADMVRRVRERTAGVESGGVSSSWLKAQIKLVYYRVFTTAYSTALLFSSYIMTNSSWTQAHIESLLTKEKNSFLTSIFLLDEESRKKQIQRGEEVSEPAECRVVYPPCDTSAFSGLKLDGRRSEIISLAQFRPEKDHTKQLHALAALYSQYPQYREGGQKVTLTLMGGSRDAGDEARLGGLMKLARDLDIDDNVEFVVNAPYSVIVERLGKASIGLNTMQDEHFGINVVEFMAAGLIPIVHASAGPLMDIVVPYKGQRTGFHATTAEEFAKAIHEALSLSSLESKKMRQAARNSALEKFSLKEFERNFDIGWRHLRTLAEKKIKQRQMANNANS